MEHLTQQSLRCSIQQLINALNEGADLDIVTQGLDFLLLELELCNQQEHWVVESVSKLTEVTALLVQELEGETLRKLGRPRIHIPIEDIEFLLSFRFKVVDIAKLYGVSRDTISGRLRDHGISVSHSYTNLTDEQLQSEMLKILQDFPNTGYKRMKGFLLSNGIKVADKRVRLAMREVDPEGVALRRRGNRAIVRRQYRMTYSNELWHLDTNMKLIRWNIIIRSCIDGKSRVVVYLDASADNTSKSNLESFLKAVTKYGIPWRTRSDKGGENVSIAQFMIENRGAGRASHICGRSVHNQRIERYWRDVYYGYTSTIASVLIALEEDGYLDIDNPKHVELVHLVFVPRINDALEVFRNAWNNHPLSTEGNYSPNQLMLLNLPPDDHVQHISQEDVDDYLCQDLSDVAYLLPPDVDSITSPMNLAGSITEIELDRLRQLDFNQPSSSFGFDIFLNAVGLLDFTS